MVGEVIVEFLYSIIVVAVLFLTWKLLNKYMEVIKKQKKFSVRYAEIGVVICKVIIIVVGVLLVSQIFFGG